jgi:hypothetical protein
MSTTNSLIDIAGDAIAGPVECECDRTLVVVAATASRATATNPVIVRNFVMETPRPKGAKGGSGTALGITNLRFRLHSLAHKMTSFAGRIVSFVLDARSSFTKSRMAGVVGSIRCLRSDLGEAADGFGPDLD